MLLATPFVNMLAAGFSFGRANIKLAATHPAQKAVAHSPVTLLFIAPTLAESGVGVNPQHYG